MNNKKILSESHKKSLSDNWRGRKDWKNGDMPANLYYDMLFYLNRGRVTRDWYDKFHDVEKLKFLNKQWSSKSRRMFPSCNVEYNEFIERFYDDYAFNRFYEQYVVSGDRWMRPSFDHVHPVSQGGDVMGLDNISVLSWLENRAKNNMNIDVWNEVKKNIQSYFVENIKHFDKKPTNKYGVYDDVFLDRGIIRQRGETSSSYRNRHTIICNLVSHIRYDIDFKWVYQFENLEMFKMLNRLIRKPTEKVPISTHHYKKFVKKFYYDSNYEKLFNIWILTGDSLMIPSLDHVVPVSRGGSCVDLDNLRIISWFENRMKADMCLDEWEQVKSNIDAYLL